MKVSIDSPHHFAEIEHHHIYDKRSLVLRAKCDGWAGSGFNREYAGLVIHKHDDGIVSIGVSVEQYKGGKDRRYEMSGTLVLPPELVEKLIGELQK